MASKQAAQLERRGRRSAGRALAGALLAPAALTAALSMGCASTQPTGSYIPADYVFEDPRRVVFLGDSISDVEEGDEHGFDTYPELLFRNDARLWPDAADQVLPVFHDELDRAVYAAVAATGSADLEEQLRKVDEGLGNQPLKGETLVVVTTGGNDLATVRPGTGLGRRAGQQILDNLVVVQDFFDDPERFPDGAYLYLTNVYDPSGPGDNTQGCFDGAQGAFLDEVISGLNQTVYDGAVDGGFALLDIFGLFREHGFGRIGNPEEDDLDPADPDPPHWFRTCTDPNARGHHEIRRMVYRAISGQEVDLP